VHHAERIAGQPDEVGYAPVADGAQPDVVVFNTCTLRGNADQTSSMATSATSATSSRSRTARPACRSPSALLAQGVTLAALLMPALLALFPRGQPAR
jgi:hypothetical protein